MAKKYQPNLLEPKWRQKWQEDGLYKVDINSKGNNYYVLVELAYTSGDLHMGHWFTFSYGDILARYNRMLGFNVIYPNGFDAFGLPAENAAIKNNIHPKDWTFGNVEKMTKQFSTMGASFDWDYSIVAADPEYYRWNQWIFLKLLEKGLVYKGRVLSNWCPVDQTVLANENIEAGRCWRCGSEVEQKEIEQWFIKITDYADRLIWQDPPQADWPKALREAQNNWIGRSQGLMIQFEDLEVFTTRPDTIFGATFLVINPEHKLLDQYIKPETRSKVEKYVEKAKKKSELERKENKDKTGVFTGSFVRNPLSGEDVPVWVADYVLPGYGTGAIMGVPAHDERDFEFAKKFGLEIKFVIKSETGDLKKDQPLESEGILIDSGEYTDLPSAKAREKISEYIVEHNLGSYQIQYHLKNWSISRQRYWGTPVPIIHCEKDGIMPVPEEDLPVELPYKVDYQPKGKPPLATAEEWLNVKCPKCGGPAKREAETMDTFIDSAWYFFRYLDPKNQKNIFDKDRIASWMPVDIYIGGAEHTFGHALYSRFISKFFKDLGLVEFEEYANKRVHHGVILGPDGHRMSKSRGNVVNPDEQVKQYGADAIRVYLSFLGPFDIVTPWRVEGINGIYHFLQRIWGLSDQVEQNLELTAEDSRNQHKTIRKVKDDIKELKFNTAIAALMEYLNYLSRKAKVAKEEYKTLLLLLAPFAPHITEELWQMLGESYSIHQQKWPKFDPTKIEEDVVKIVIQVNSKVRDVLEVAKDGMNKEEVEELAKKSPKVQKFLENKDIKKSIYIPGEILNLVV